MASNVPTASDANEIEPALPVVVPVAPPQAVPSRNVEREPLNRSPLSTPRTAASPGRLRIVLMADKVLSTTASLSQLLPTGTVLAYNSISSSFANQGSCYTVNKYLTGSLIGVCTISCILFTFTDSIRGEHGKLYYGIATPWNFKLLNYSRSDEGNVPVLEDEQAEEDRQKKEKEERKKKLRKYRLRPRDYFHAILNVLLFLAVAFSNVTVWKCFFPHAGPNVKQLLLNLPLGASLLSSTFFLVFPTHRKGIGYTNTLGLPGMPAL